ncbi:hypothetical protein [Chryseobacterium sp.]|uniref:hypothetical protein n=1 Tax=Chryseobacterium sp. TaxID=1871047 RepID=UPI00289970C8|nr:hypothetical protein [Chryseobacterium sp.]
MKLIYINSLNKFCSLFICIFIFCIACGQKNETQKILSSDFNFAFVIENSNKGDVINSKISVNSKGENINKGKFEISSEDPILSSMKFEDGNIELSAQDTIAFKIESKQYFITDIKNQAVSRTKGLSPFSSSKPSIISFKVNGKEHFESDYLSLK